MREEVLMSPASTAAGVKSIVKSDTSLVVHSYDGAAIPDAGSGLKVAALVCVAAFTPDKRESVSTLIAYVSQPKAVASIIEALWRMSND